MPPCRKRSMASTSSSQSIESTASVQSDMGPPPTKRQKFSSDLVEVLTEVINAGDGIRKNLLPLVGAPEVKNTFILVSRWTQHADKVLRALNSKSRLLKTYADEVPPLLTDQPEFERDCLRYQEELRKFANLPPSISPSAFAKPGGWIDHQDREDHRILCYRPPTARGVALNLLHDVFQEFREIWLNLAEHSIDLDISNTARAVVAYLMSTIPGGSTHSEPEARREQEFWGIIRPLLGHYTRGHQLGTDSCWVEVDGMWSIWDSRIQRGHLPLALLVLKDEIGSSGDPFMQLARTYQVAVNDLQSQETSATKAILAEGAPMFLIGLVDTDFFVAGGFYDGKDTLVEHFAQLRLVEDGFGTVHRENIVRLFCTLTKAMQSLRHRMNQVLTSQECLQPFPPSTPRLYRSWKPFPDDGPNIQVTFIRLIPPLASGRHIFFGSLGDFHVFIKLVDEPYGLGVHQCLAERKLAPQLWACATPNRLPTAYAMEYLDDWKVLEAVDTSEWTDDMISSVMQQLNKALWHLKDNKMVHGDLRSANIMFKLKTQEQREEDTVDIRIIDFDWAGEAGKVTYPLGLNPSIRWPAAPGSPIQQDHDLTMVKTWWPRQFPYFDFIPDKRL